MVLLEVLRREEFTREEIAFLRGIDSREFHLLAQSQNSQRLLLEVIDRIPDDDIGRKIFTALF